MKRFWLYSFALSVGVSAAQHAAAQYPTYNYNTGPSSYSVQVPSTYQNPYQLAATQDQAPAYGNAEAVQPKQPVPPGQQYSPLPLSPPPAPATGPSAVPPQADYNQYQTIAPGCATCGPAPFSQSHSHGGYGSPYAYSTPSVGWGDCGGCQPSHFGGGHFGKHHALGNFAALPEAAKPWFFGGGVLIFRRVDDYNRLLSVDDADMPILYTGDAAMQTMGGFEVMGGRYFNCGKNAIMASYWGLFPENEMVSTFDGGAGIRSSIFRPWGGPDPWTGEFQLNQTGNPVGDPTSDSDIYDLYDTASGHRLRRSSEFHSVEINLLGFSVGSASRNFNRPTGGSLFSGGHHHRGGGIGSDGCQTDCGNGTCGQGDCGSCGAAPSRFATGPCGYVAPPCGSRLNFSWLAGIRYLQFNDNLEYAALGVPGLGAQTLSYDVYTRNQLVGFQLGGRSDLCLGNRFNLYSTARAGIFGNNASLTSRLGTETAIAYESNDPDTLYDISRRRNQLAFLSELGAGMGVRLSPKWTATAGYRAIVASGVATAVGNVRQQGQTIGRLGINSQDYVLLHGLDIGALYNF